VFRPLRGVNLVEALHRSGKAFLHTGYTYNGGGCSNNLHKSILAWIKNNLTRSGISSASQKQQQVAAVSDGKRWWTQDDNVYYSNFVVSSVAFHAAPGPLSLARYLNEDVEEGFFKYRWTDQSLFHKVFGVFLGPDEKDFLLDFSWMRCSKKNGYRKGAVFYHSKKEKRRSELAKCTDV
jgi:hypothetical protein